MNELVGSRTKNLSAWDINVSHGQWLYPDPDTYVPNEIWSSCGGGNKWYGWSGSPGNEVENIGSISTILPVSGKIRLGFGNCWNSGNVILSLNGVLKSSARNNSQHISTFKFEAGDKLLLSDEGHNSIIQFNFINLTNCSPSQGIKRPGTVSPHLMHNSHFSKICLREISRKMVSFKEILLNND